MKLSNPTGLPRRISDKWGSGHFGAPRGSRVHMGLDLQARVGQFVRSPIRGVLVRQAKPYGDGTESDCGIYISGEGEHAGVSVKMFYIRVPSGMVGKVVNPNEIIGTASDLRKRYDGIMNHVHIEVRVDGKRVDPEPLIFGADEHRERHAHA